MNGMALNKIECCHSNLQHSKGSNRLTLLYSFACCRSCKRKQMLFCSVPLTVTLQTIAGIEYLQVCTDMQLRTPGIQNVGVSLFVN